MAFNIDPAHSTIGFSVRHMMIAKVRGSFHDYQVSAKLDAQDLARSSVEATIEVASIDTGNPDRDKHLRSADFFDAERFGQIRFASTKVEASADGGYVLHGDLTIRDVTRPVSLAVEANGPGKDPWGNVRYGFGLRGKIDREEFGLTWNQALEAGGVLVGKEVSFDIEIQVIEVRAQAEAGASASA